MADALCGPSNPLQQFRKATQVDRTLQQDRLTNRASPAQGFRSSPGPSAGTLDPEFEAFQAGLPTGPSLQEPRQFPPQPFQPGHVEAQSQIPAWAADFQRMHISPQPPAPASFGPLQQRSIPSGQASWQRDFLRQQSQASPPITNLSQQHDTPVNSMFGGVPRYGMFNQSSFEPSFAEGPEMSTVMGKQPEGAIEQQWDDEAFARAFDQAHEEMVSMQDALVDPQKNAQPLDDGTMKNVLREQQEMKVQLTEPSSAQGEEFLDAAELAQLAAKSNEEARLHWENTRMVYDLSDDPLADQHDILDAIEAETQARAASEPRTLPQQEQKQEQPAREADADDLSRTAGQLLDSVANDMSDKFQNSSFLALMRRLRDREVRVEGDKMVEVRDISQSSSSATFEPPSASSTPVSEMSIASSLPVSMASSQTSSGAYETEELDAPMFPTTVPPYMSDWVDGEGIRHRHSWPANAERCKHHGCSEVQGHMHDEWSDIADTNADAD